jgi:cytochrome c oxidase subunit I+III
MTATDPDRASGYGGAAKGAREASFEAIWAQPRGLRVLSAVSHRVVGKRFVYTGFAFFLIAGLLALLVRTQLIVPEASFLDHETYNQVFTMHGTLMMFLFAIPILEGFAVYLIPLMLGARDLIFPRLGAFGYWCYLFGGLILLSSFVFDAAPAGGWFMYTPLSSTEYSPGLGPDFWLIGVTFAEIASVTAAVELIAAILCARAPGMSLTKMPVFAWYILVFAFMIAVGFPPLIIGSVLLETQRLIGLPFFDPALGGDPLLWQHLFWLFGHPEVYIIFLPAAGFVGTILPTFVGKPLFGYGFVVASVIAMGFISFGLWAHHMFATGLPVLSLSLFSAASTMVAVPTGVQIFAYIATLAQGRPRATVPMLFVLGFLFVFVLGGFTGVMLAAVPFNWQAHDSYFVVAHLHYVLIGGMVFPMFAAFYYWAPHFTGRMMSERLGRWVFWLIFTGFNVAFLTMHLTGLRGMPRRVATYPEGIGWDRLNLLSTLGAYVLAAGVALFLFDLIRHRWSGPPAGRNPWGAATLEWLYPLPTPGFNFHRIPPVESREPLWDQPELTDREAHAVEGHLEGATDGRRETIGCDPVSGEPLQIVRLPHPTWVPMVAAAFIAVAAIATLASAYAVAAAGAAGFVAAVLWWGWEPSDAGVERETGAGLRLPVAVVDRRGHTHVATVGTLLILFALHASLIFGALYLWNTQPGFAERTAPAEILPAALAALAAGLAAAAGQGARALSLRHRAVSAGLAALVTAAAALGAVLALWAALAPVDAWGTALGAVFWASGAYVALLLGVVALWGMFAAARDLSGAARPGQGAHMFNLATMAKGVGAMTAATAALLIGDALWGAA